MTYSVKAVADMAGVSIRALHHYDQIGLLKPASVSPSGYRQYTDADLERLQQVLFFRELGFGLKEIGKIVDSPAFDRKEALTMHRRLLVEKQRRIESLIRAVDQSIDAMEGKETMDRESMFGAFDESEIEAYREEARQRWGDTDAYRESTRRAARYGKADWTAIQSESDEINRALAGLMDQDPASRDVQEWVGKWHRLINDRFYTCPPEMFRGLGDLYVEDARFTAFYDKYKPGLAAFLRSAMHAYADGVAKQ
ncbi:MAG: MerR family transcriptional regulator [Dehalococcoidia bacterium]